MWKVFLAFGAHRFLLLAIALFTINSRISPERPGYTFKKILPFSELSSHFMEKVRENPESAVLERAAVDEPSKIFHMTTNPFVWAGRFLMSLFGLAPGLAILILSNLFCLLFLWEVNALLNRMALPEVASRAAILCLLWVTSYELSLGSSFSLTCFLSMVALRHSIDNLWIVTGFALALLGMTEPLLIGLLPMVLFIFVHYQRHFPLAQVAKRVAFLLIPVIAVIVWRWDLHGTAIGGIRSSALFDIWNNVRGGEFSPLFSKSRLGQSFGVGFFMFGAIAAFTSHTTAIHRVMPLYTLLLVLLFSSYHQLASRLLLAAPCMGGVTGVASGILIRIIQLGLIILGCYEIFTVFQ